MSFLSETDITKHLGLAMLPQPKTLNANIHKLWFDMDYMKLEFVPQREKDNAERSHIKILLSIIVNGKVIARDMHHTVLQVYRQCSSKI